MIEDSWRRIAGLHVTDAGDVAVVWMALNKEADTIHLYDCAFFRGQPPAIISEGISARGKWIPVAWEAKAKPTSEMLLDRGLNLIDPLKEDDALAEITSKEIKGRMLSKRFKVALSAKEWGDEYNTFYRDETKVPRDSHPLMAATRYAVAQLSWARPLRLKGKKLPNHPRIAMI